MGSRPRVGIRLRARGDAPPRLDQPPLLQMAALLYAAPTDGRLCTAFRPLHLQPRHIAKRLDDKSTSSGEFKCKGEGNDKVEDESEGKNIEGKG